MKTLLLNFMFFVGSALILIQCARLFPSSLKPVTPHISGAVNKLNPVTDNPNHTARLFNNSFIRQAASKNGFFSPMPNYSSLSYQMMLRLNGGRLFSNPYALFKRYNIADNANTRLTNEKQ